MVSPKDAGILAELSVLEIVPACLTLIASLVKAVQLIYTDEDSSIVRILVAHLPIG